MIDRRGFLKGILAAGCAPAMVRIGSIMPVRQIALPTLEETLAINGYFIGEGLIVGRVFEAPMVASIYSASPLISFRPVKAKL